MTLIIQHEQMDLKGHSTNFAQSNLFFFFSDHVESYYYVRKVKHFVAPEEALCNLIPSGDVNQWLSGTVGNVGTRFMKSSYSSNTRCA